MRRCLPSWFVWDGLKRKTIITAGRGFGLATSAGPICRFEMHGTDRFVENFRRPSCENTHCARVWTLLSQLTQPKRAQARHHYIVGERQLYFASEVGGRRTKGRALDSLRREGSWKERVKGDVEIIEDGGEPRGRPGGHKRRAESYYLDSCHRFEFACTLCVNRDCKGVLFVLTDSSLQHEWGQTL